MIRTSRGARVAAATVAACAARALPKPRCPIPLSISRRISDRIERIVEEPRCVRDLSGRVLHVPDHRAGHRDPDCRPDLPLAVDRPAQGATAREGSQLMRRFLHPLLIATLMILSAMPRVEAAPSEAPDSVLAAVFFRYYGALQKERYEEALGLLHERLRQALQVRTAKDLAARSIVAQRNLVDAFRRFDNLDVAKTEVDLTSIKATVTAAEAGNVAGEGGDDLVVLPMGPGRPLMFRGVMGMGVSQGGVIRVAPKATSPTETGALAD